MKKAFIVVHGIETGRKYAVKKSIIRSFHVTEFKGKKCVKIIYNGIDGDEFCVRVTEDFNYVLEEMNKLV